MKMVNNKTENPLKYYREKTGEFDPNELSLKSGVPFDGREFHLTVMGRPVSMQWPELVCRYDDDGKEAGSAIIILMTRLVMYGVLTPPNGAPIISKPSKEGALTVLPVRTEATRRSSRKTRKRSAPGKWRAETAPSNLSSFPDSRCARPYGKGTMSSRRTPRSSSPTVSFRLLPRRRSPSSATRS